LQGGRGEAVAHRPVWAEQLVFRQLITDAFEDFGIWQLEQNPARCRRE
jgi:hypothetical protein